MIRFHYSEAYKIEREQNKNEKHIDKISMRKHLEKFLSKTASHKLSLPSVLALSYSCKNLPCFLSVDQFAIEVKQSTENMENQHAGFLFIFRWLIVKQFALINFSFSFVFIFFSNKRIWFMSFEWKWIKNTTEKKITTK